MIHIASIEIHGKSERGDFVGRLEFSPGLQVISGRNSFGKSLAAKSIVWCLPICRWRRRGRLGWLWNDSPGAFSGRGSFATEGECSLMANRAALHEALRTEVVDRHGASGLNLVLVRLQRSKTDITFSLHAEPTMFNLSGQFMSAHLLERLGFSVGDCAFVERKKCLARGVPEGFDVRGFATAIATATETLRKGCDALLECGFFVGAQTL